MGKRCKRSSSSSSCSSRKMKALINAILSLSLYVSGGVGGGIVAEIPTRDYRATKRRIVIGPSRRQQRPHLLDVEQQQQQQQLRNLGSSEAIRIPLDNNENNNLEVYRMDDRDNNPSNNVRHHKPQKHKPQHHQPQNVQQEQEQPASITVHKIQKHVDPTSTTTGMEEGHKENDDIPFASVQHHHHHHVPNNNDDPFDSTVSGSAAQASSSPEPESVVPSRPQAQHKQQTPITEGEAEKQKASSSSSSSITVTKSDEEKKEDKNAGEDESGKAEANSYEPQNDDTDNTSMIITIVVASVLGLLLCCMAFCIIQSNMKRKYNKEREHKMMMSIFKYVQVFDVDDIDIRRTPAGGYECTYLNDLAYGGNSMAPPPSVTRGRGGGLSRSPPTRDMAYQPSSATTEQQLQNNEPTFSDGMSKDDYMFMSTSIKYAKSTRMEL